MNPAAATLALLMASAVLSAACAVYCALDVRFHFAGFARVLSGLFGLLLVLQSSLIGLQVVGGARFSLAYQILILTAWGLLACSLFFNRYLFADLIGVLVCGVDSALLVLALLMRQPEPCCPAPAAAPGLSWLLYLHVSAILLSYVVLTLAFISALGYLLRDRGLKSKRRGRALDSLPPLATLEGFTDRFVLAGFLALTAGIVLSQVFVVASHRRGIFFDPREALALVSWLLYAAYAGLRLLVRFEGRRLALLVVAGYATGLAPAVVITSLGAARPF
ncbi:MAG TPA: cytochrome c biogenesis protein CcsA [Candidatus Dormibacteraeota bacterium]|jgi:ABC-type transport system involved in cytochrome c biogenesis permease subunit|nr:cytochrome c biogenesis protein CcsA [Candidatus Dormibacteraeota bacterium]